MSPLTSPPKQAPPTRRLVPRKYTLSERCTGACSMSERALPNNAFAIVHSWFEEGANNDLIHARSKDLLGEGRNLSLGAIGRHRRNHLVPEDQMHTVEELEAMGGTAKPLSDLEILERLIQAGSKALADKKVRVSPEMTMKAMELKYKLTQGNVFQGFLDAVNAAMDGDGGPESEEAVASPDERAQAAPEAPE